MNIAILGKVGSAILFAGTSSTIGVAIFDRELLGLYSKVYLYVITTSPSVSGTKDNNNFECKFKTDPASDSFDCKIHALTDESVKQHKINELSNSKKRTEVKSDDAFSTINKIFQVQFSSKYWNKGKNEEKDLEIIAKTTKKTHSNFKQLFAKYISKKITQSAYFIVKANKDIESAIDANSMNECFFDAAATKNKLTCEIFNFADTETADDNSNYSTLKFNHPLTKASTIEKNKHYLVKFEKAVDFTSIKKQTIYGGSTKTTFINVESAIYHDKYDHIFII